MKVAKIQNLIDNPEAIKTELNIPELENMIKAFFPGIPLELKFEIDPAPSRGSNEARFCVTSNDITEYCGAFAQVMERVQITQFSNSIRFDEVKGLTVWFQLNLSYSHFDGGSNGSNISEFYFEDGNWTKERFKGDKRFC